MINITPPEACDRTDRVDAIDQYADRDRDLLEEAEAIAGAERLATDGGESNTHASQVNKQLALADGGGDDEGLDPLYIGDHVQDREDPDATMVVVGMDTLQADAYELGDGGPTVAEVNPEYPPTDDVVECVFPNRTDMDIDKKRYAYPRARLERIASVHSDEGEE